MHVYGHYNRLLNDAHLGLMNAKVDLMNLQIIMRGPGNLFDDASHQSVARLIDEVDGLIDRCKDDLERRLDVPPTEDEQ